MAELVSLTSLYIFLGVLTGVAVLCAVFWAARRAIGRHGADGAKEGVVSSAAGTHQGLLNKDVAVPLPPSGQAPPERDNSDDAQLCAICKARLADAGWSPCRRLRPCGHVFHGESIGLWLQRKWICPLCRAGVVVSRTETIDAMA